MNSDNIILYNDDCLKIMSELRGGGTLVDLVLTDPPYNTTSCKWDKLIPFDKMWECLHGVTKSNTPILLFGQEPFSSRLRMSNIEEFKYDWIWYKNKPSGFANAKYKPMCNHEIISVFYKDKPTYNPIKEPRDWSKNSLKRNKDLKSDFIIRNGNYGSNTQGLDQDDKNVGKVYDKMRNPTTVKKFDVVPNNKGSRLHPTQKPIELLEYLIKTYTNEGDTVLDFTAGVMSTGVACKNLGRRFIGIELDKTYFDIGKERIFNDENNRHR